MFVPLEAVISISWVASAAFQGINIQSPAYNLPTIWALIVIVTNSEASVDLFAIYTLAAFPTPATEESKSITLVVAVKIILFNPVVWSRSACVPPLFKIDDFKSIYW